MNKNIFKKTLIVVGIILGFASILGIAYVKDANAAVGGVYDKIKASSLIACYQANQFITPRKKDDFKKSSISNLMSGSQKVYDSTGTKSVKCSEYVKGLLDDKGAEIPGATTTDSAFNNFMTNMGYDKGNAVGTGKCISFDYTASGYSGKITTPKICASSITNMGNGAVNSVMEIVDATSVNKKFVNYTYNTKSGKLTIKCGSKTCGSITITKGSTNWSEVESVVKEAVLSDRNSARVSIGGKYYDFGLDGLGSNNAMKVTPYGEVTADYTLTVNDNSLKRATGYLVGTQYGSKPVFLDNEHFVLYQNYLLDFYGGNNDVHCDWTTEEQKMAYVKSHHIEVRLYQNGAMKTCYINSKKMTNKNKSVGGINGSGTFGEDCNFDCVLNWLKANTTNYTGLENLGIINPVDGGNPDPSDPSPTPSPNPGSGSTADLDRCDGMVKEYIKEGEKIGAMQWILCPTMDNTRYTASWIDNMTTDWLETKVENYESGSVAEIAWKSVRDIANVAMVVFLVVIIFSQITGYGIDNYGIKKMLPRLIIMAIVVNLSFYICQLVVDLSNIAGVGLRDMFGAIGTRVAGEQTIAGTDFLGTMITGLFASSGGISAAVGAAVTAGTIGAPILIAVIMVVIAFAVTILVAVAILFLMLAAREIIVILCIALSPLAFAAFILPNTQNLFKKWWDLFKAALIIYPICGAMSGISYMLRAMAMKDSGGENAMELNWWGYAIITLLPYLGFFLLPILLKNALAALGKVGGALSSMGQTIRNGGRQLGQSAMRVAQSTEGYKNLQTEAARRRQSNSSQRTIDRLEALKKQREAEGGRLSERETRQLARAHETQRRLGNEEMAARTILAEKDYAGKSQAELLSDWNRAFDSGDAEKMDALTNVIVSRHGPGGVNDIAKSLATKNIFAADGKGFVGGPDSAMEKSFNALRTNMSQNSALANAMQSKASDAYQMITSGGYDSDGKARHNMAYHTQNNNIATQDKDWATQSSATLRRAAESGALSQQVAQRMLNSTDPTVMSGIQSDASKREILEAAASGLLATKKDSTPNAAQAAAIQWNEKNPNTDKSYVEEAATSYRNAVNQAEFNVRAAEEARISSRDRNIERIADNLDRQNGGNDNNSGQGFDGGAGI